MEENGAGSKAARILKMLAILAHHGAPMLVADLARRMGVSERTIGRYLTDATDLCPALYQEDDGRPGINLPIWRQWVGVES